MSHHNCQTPESLCLTPAETPESLCLTPAETQHEAQPRSLNHVAVFASYLGLHPSMCSPMNNYILQLLPKGEKQNIQMGLFLLDRL